MYGTLSQSPTSTSLGVVITHNQNTRIFIPNRQGSAMTTHAYISYTYVVVFCLRQIDVVGDLLEKAPPGFAELRSEILGFTKEKEEGLLQVAGMQPAGEGQDPASMLFILVTDECEYPWKGPFLREVNPPFSFFQDDLIPPNETLTRA